MSENIKTDQEEQQHQQQQQQNVETQKQEKQEKVEPEPKIEAKTETKQEKKVEQESKSSKKEEPKTMKSIVLTGPKTYELKETPIPVPESGEVLVKVMAAPINPSDLALFDGHYSHQKKFPAPMGFEGSGLVVKSGGGIMGWTMVGKKVAFAVEKESEGSYSQYAIVKAAQCLPLDDETTFEEGSMSLINPMTALAMLEILKEKKLKSVVMTAAASALVRMINRVFPNEGVEVINIVRRQEQVDVLKAEGAKNILNSTSEKFEEELKELTKKLNTKQCFEAIGGEMTGIVMRNMPNGSTVTLYGILAATEFMNVSSRDLLINDKSLNSFLLPVWMKTQSITTLLPLFYKVRKLISGAMKTKVAKKFSMENLDEAIKYYLSNMTEGKVLIEPNGPTEETKTV